MSSTYGTIIGNIWPPPNQETLERLQRLKELQELRQSRETRVSQAAGSSSVRHEPVSSSDSSRASRRQLLSSYRPTTSRLRDRQEDLRTRNIERTSSVREDVESERMDYGGAKPKRLGYSRSVTESDSPGSEILRELRRQREQAAFTRTPRARTVSGDSDTSEEQTPFQSKANFRLDLNNVTAEPTEHRFSNGLSKEAEKDAEGHNVSAESEHIDLDEDMEQFKQSLYGSYSYGVSNSQSTSYLQPFSFTESPVSKGIDISRFGLSRSLHTAPLPARDSSEKPSIRSSYDVKEGFKRIDDLFGSNSSTQSSRVSEPVKLRSRLKRNEDDAGQRNNVRNRVEKSRNVQLDTVSEKKEHVQSVNDDIGVKLSAVTNDTEQVKESESVKMESEVLAQNAESSEKQQGSNLVTSEKENSKRVLIFDGESMVVEDDEGDHQTIVSQGADDQGDTIDSSNDGVDAKLSSSPQDETIVTEEVAKQTPEELHHVADDIEIGDTGPIIVGSTLSGDTAIEIDSNEGESILTESDSIFDYKRQHQDLDSYFDAQESSGNLYSSQQRRDIPSYSRTKSMPYGTQGRTNRYSSLPSSIDEKLAEFRARYSSQHQGLGSVAPSSYQSDLGKPLDLDSIRSSLNRPYLTKSHSNAGSDNSNRSDSVVSRIVNKSFKSFDKFFEAPRQEVVLRRRTSRPSAEESLSASVHQESRTYESRSRTDKSLFGSRVQDVISGASLKSDVTERECNFSHDIEESISQDVPETCEVPETDGDRSHSDQVDDVDVNVDTREDDVDDRSDVVEVDEDVVKPCTVESGNIIHLDPDAISKHEDVQRDEIEDNQKILFTKETDRDNATKCIETNVAFQEQNVSVERADEHALAGDTSSPKHEIPEPGAKDNQIGKSKKKDKKKKGKKKKGQSNKETSEEQADAIEIAETSKQGQTNIDRKVTSEVVVLSGTSESDTLSEQSSKTISDESKPSKSSSKIKRLFEGIVDAIDHRSDRTSVATEDLLSLGSSDGIVSDKISVETEQSQDVAEDLQSLPKDIECQCQCLDIDDDHFAKFDGEDFPSESGSRMDSLPDEVSATSTEGETFETASETTESGEFFEAIPAEFVGSTLAYNGEITVNGPYSSVERKEKFVYVLPFTKIRKRKIKMKSLLRTSVVKKQAKLRERQRLGQVKAWMENNIFPTEGNQGDQGVLLAKTIGCKQESANSAESVADDTESKASISSQDNSTSKFSDQTVSSGSGTMEVEQVQPIKTSTASTQTDMSTSPQTSSSTQTLLRTWNIGVQVETLITNASTQTIAEILCPCCNETIDLKAALIKSNVVDKTSSKKIKQNDVETEVNLVEGNISEQISLDLKSHDSTDDQSNRSVKHFSSGGSISDSSKSPSKPSSPMSQSPLKLSPSSTPPKQSPIPSPRRHKSLRGETKTPVKSRREKVADVKDMLYNSDINKEKSQKAKKPPIATTPVKSKSRDSSKERAKSKSSEKTIPRASKPKSRDPSDDRSSCTGSDKNDVPSYMHPTRSSTHKTSKSRENSEEREKVGVRESKNRASGKEFKTHKRTDSYKKARSRENSKERTENEKDTVRSDLPGYMQPTRSSKHKTTEASTPTKKPLTSTNSHSSNEGENHEHIASMKENPFYRVDSEKRKKNGEGLSVFERLGNSVKQEGSEKGKWYRKEPIKDSSLKKSPKAKSKSPRKTRAMSWSGIDVVSEQNGHALFDSKDGKEQVSSGKLETMSLGSRSSLLENDLDLITEHSSTSDKKTDIAADMNDFDCVKNKDAKLVFDSSTLNGSVNGESGPSAKDSLDEELQKSGEEAGHVDLSAEEKALVEEERGRIQEVGHIDLSAEEKALAEEGRGRIQEVEEDEIAPVRVNLTNWDPTKLLKDLYSVKLMSDTTQDISDKFIAMEGLMEKLPMNKKKATLLKTWKRRFFRAKDGWLHYYETGNRDKPSDSLQLMGGKVDDLGNRILGVDDGRGRYLMVRCPTDKEYGQWKLALESQTADNVRATYVRPALQLPQHPDKSIIIIDIGSSGIRAGILGEQATLPQLFFPSTVARHKKTVELVTGIEAYTPETRHNSDLRKPVYPTEKVDKFGIDVETIGAVFKKIFTELGADSSKFFVMISTPQNLGDKLRSSLMEILIDHFRVRGVCMVMQALLALYSYNATSGIIVDVGERMEILPIYDGYVIEGGVSQQSYGGQKVGQSLNHSLEKYKFSTPIQQLLVRYVMEQSCYVTLDYKDTLRKCDEDPDSYKTMISLSNYDLPEGADVTVTHDYSCFKSPEGFFNTDIWGMDYPCVHKLVFKAIQSCPMDGRKRMYRAVYLSGGVTLLPGFAERLQLELSKLAPPSVVVEVHASPNRYHSAFIGACALANMDQFQQIAISAEEWRKEGVKAFRKWKMS